MQAPRGLFLTFEGGEGTGKSTQVARLVTRLNAMGRSAIATREPGGSPGAERIRGLLLDPAHDRFSSLSETLLFYAARAEHLARTIRPALDAGQWVICDRFSDSSRAYQGVLGAVPSATLQMLDQIVVGDTRPDLTFILDVDANVGLARAAARRGNAETDGFEKESLSFHQGLRQAFLAMANAEPDRYVVIDAGQGFDAVTADIWTSIEHRFLQAEGTQA